MDKLMDKRLRRRQMLYLGLGLAGVGAAIAAPALKKAALSADSSDLTTPYPAPINSDSAIASASTQKRLPEFQGIDTWLNSNPLTIAGLKGNVVLIQFWTFACINCQRTLPKVVEWHQQYAAQGLRVIGVHTPEFAFERQADNIKAALQQHQITYPVPIDNDYRTWNAYGNQYWPHFYLADRQGVLQYDHIGEGAYRETEQKIQQLLQSS